MTPPPVFRTCACGWPAMPNSPQCCECRNIALGWNYDEAVYRKPEPFEAGTEDSNWTDEMEGITQDDDPVRLAG